MEWVQDDGGRAAAGYRGITGDCVVRSIAIATEKPYQEVYDALFEAQRELGESGRCRKARRVASRGASPRSGVFDKVYRPYLERLGWRWVPTMQIGQGCKVHLRAAELPSGRLIVRVSKHMVAVIDGIIHDAYDPSRGGTRCVYGYFTAPGAA